VSNPFTSPQARPLTTDPRFSREELTLANRNHGAMLELLRADVTPTGAHYLLNHFDVPVLEPAAHRLRFHGAFEAPYTLDMDEIRALPAVTQPVTMECAGNGRVAGYDQRSVSMPWTYGAVGTSSWTGARSAAKAARRCASSCRAGTGWPR
jgi:DMSO/TMAO reductase YedYZ molybdopterin-dependent catalytic subunit